MPRLNQSLPKYRKHKASGQAVVSLDGKDFYLGPHGSRASRREYDSLVGEWQQNGRRLPASGEHNALSIAELLNQYRKWARGYYVKNGKPTGTIANITPMLKLSPSTSMSTTGFIWNFTLTTSRQLEFRSLKFSENTKRKGEIKSEYCCDKRTGSRHDCQRGRHVETLDEFRYHACWAGVGVSCWLQWWEGTAIAIRFPCSIRVSQDCRIGPGSLNLRRGRKRQH